MFNECCQPACPDYFGEPVEGGLTKSVIPASTSSA